LFASYACIWNDESMYACSSAVYARRNCPRSVLFMQLLIPLLQLLLTLHTVRNSLSCGSTQHCISIVLISFQCLEPKQKEEVRRSSCHNWTRMVIRLGRFTDTDRDQSRWVLLVNCMDPTKLFDKPRAHSFFPALQFVPGVFSVRVWALAYSLCRQIYLATSKCELLPFVFAWCVGMMSQQLIMSCLLEDDQPEGIRNSHVLALSLEVDADLSKRIIQNLGELHPTLTVC
jgi:hypothetical protein